MRILKNYLYNVTYQLLVIILPILTTPYVSRVLEVDGVGRYSVTSAIVNYFVLFGILGINTYGNRQVAYVRDNKKQLSRVFYEIVFLKLITMSISIIVFCIYLQKIDTHENFILYSMQIFTLIASLVDISWFFYGMEEFKKTAIRNIVVKLISIILIFILVKEKSDIWIYALIIAGSLFAGQVVIWKDVRGLVYFVKPEMKNLGFHLKNTLYLWIPSLAIQVYTSLDKIMLGYLADYTQAGLYENSQKLVRMAATVTTSLATVTMPRVANSFKNDDISQIRNVSNRSFAVISLISFPMTFGIMAVRETIVPWFYGPGYEEIIKLLFISGWIIISLGWSSVFGAQILIGCRKENQFTIAVTLGAIVNIILNSILIIRYKATGAIFASIVAEYVGMFLMLFFVRKIVNVKEIFKPIPSYLIASLVMYFFVYYAGKLMILPLIATIVQILIGIFVYFGVLFVVKDENMKYVLSKVFSLMKRKYE